MLAMATMAFVASNIAAISIDIGMPLRDKFSPRPRGTWRLSAGLKGRHPPSMPSGHVAHMVLRRAPHGLATLPCKAGVRARVEGRHDLKWGVRARVGHKRNPQIIVSSAYGWLPYTDPRGICRSGSSSVGHLPSTQMCGGRVIYTIRTQILLASVDVCRLRSATSQWLSTQMCGRGRLYKSVHRPSWHL